MSSIRVCLIVCILLSLAGACMSWLPYAQYAGNRAYFLRQRTICRGPKVYEINNVQDVDQCKDACVQFDCAAVNLLQVGEFDFVCEVLGSVYSYEPTTGSACYVGA